MRSSMLSTACEVEVPEAVAWAKDKFASWMNDGTAYVYFLTATRPQTERRPSDFIPSTFVAMASFLSIIGTGDLIFLDKYIYCCVLLYLTWYNE